MGDAEEPGVAAAAGVGVERDTDREWPLGKLPLWGEEDEGLKAGEWKQTPGRHAGARRILPSGIDFCAAQLAVSSVRQSTCCSGHLDPARQDQM